MVVSSVGLQISEEGAGARRGTHHFGRSLECSEPNRSDFVQGPAIVRHTTSRKGLKLAVTDISTERILVC